jgi:RHS repeat-associated protein
MDRLISETSTSGVVSYTYDAAGRRGTMSASGQGVVGYSYDTGNRLTQISATTSSGNVTEAFGYDTASRRISLSLANGVVGSYTYDESSRIGGISYTKGPTLVGNLTYAYDAAGRLTAVGGTLSGVSMPSALASATYDPANQIQSWGGVGVQYDADGNMTGDGAHTYTWNSRNQLVAMIGGGVSASFGYDSIGRRVSRSLNGVSRSFLYDGRNVIQELNGSAVVAKLLTGFNVDEIFARTDSSGRFHFATDAMGSTVGLLDGTGSLQTRYTYDPYGGTLASGSSSANTYQYIGREDDGSGLYSFRARYYSPAFARFISEDPIGVAGGVNVHSYANGSPTEHKDSLGLDSTVSFWFGGSGHVGVQPGNGLPITGFWPDPGANTFCFLTGLCGSAHGPITPDPMTGTPPDATLTLPTTPQQEQQMQKFMSNYNGRYSFPFNNCANFAADAIGAGGFFPLVMGGFMTPMGLYLALQSMLNGVTAAPMLPNSTLWP